MTETTLEPLPPRLRLCTRSEAAQLLSISTRQVSKLMSLGKIKPVRLGTQAVRISLVELEDFIKRGGFTPASEAPHE
jgi:excisionase family DNA binding protein